VDLGERKVPKHEPEPGAQPLLNSLDNRIHVPTVRTFEITVLYQCDRRIGRTLNVITLGVHRL
jgi:hypothetical protein